MARFIANEIFAGYHEDIVLDVNFEVKESSMIAIIGKNGSGKSTLLKALMKNIERCRGSVLVDGINLFDLSIKARAKKISMLTQSFDSLEGLLVKEIIEMGKYPYQNRFFDKPVSLNYEWLEDLSIVELLDSQYHKLSKGQQQLVQLARVFHQETPIMLLDEPDSSLDYMNKHALYCKLVSMVKQQKKIGIVVLHDPMLALEYFDEIFIFDQGRIIEKIKKGENVENIEKKLQTIYPQLSLYKDKEKGLYYSSLRNYEKK